jgi:predicted NBD/HSP70 family sugar kinase
LATLPDSDEGPPSEGEFVRALRDHGLASIAVPRPLTAVGLNLGELAEHSGLSRPSVTALIERFAPVLETQDLKGQQVDQEEAELPYSARRWAIAPNIGAVAAIEIGEQGVRVALTDLYGRFEETPRTVEARTVYDTLRHAIAQIRELLHRRPLSDLVGVGVSLAAPVEQDRGVRPGAPSGQRRAAVWKDWELVSVLDHLRASLGPDLPIRLDNNANVDALAELVWGAARPAPERNPRSYRNVVYVEWSRGIGAGLIFDGELYRGEGVAGEIGHVVVRDASDAPVCEFCGNNGCLESVAGWEAILRRLPAYPAKRRLVLDELRKTLELAANPDSPEARQFARAAEDLARVLGPVISFLNPQLVVIGGDVGRLGFRIIDSPLQLSLRRYTMRPALADVTVVQTELPDEAPLQGAVALVVRPSRGEQRALLRFLRRKAGPRPK